MLGNNTLFVSHPFQNAVFEEVVTRLRGHSVVVLEKQLQGNFSEAFNSNWVDGSVRQDGRRGVHPEHLKSSVIDIFYIGNEGVFDLIPKPDFAYMSSLFSAAFKPKFISEYGSTHLKKKIFFVTFSTFQQFTCWKPSCLCLDLCSLCEWRSSREKRSRLSWEQQNRNLLTMITKSF